MKNFERAYNQVMIKMINEKLDGEGRRYEVYEGSDEDLIYIADLDSQCSRLQQRIMSGAKCVLKHIAFAEDLNEIGDGIYLRDRPTDFTQPAFVLS